MGHLEGITFIDSRGDGRHLITNGKDQTTKLWDIRRMTSTVNWSFISLLLSSISLFMCISLSPSLPPSSSLFFPPALITSPPRPPLIYVSLSLNTYCVFPLLLSHLSLLSLDYPLFLCFSVSFLAFPFFRSPSLQFFMSLLSLSIFSLFLSVLKSSLPHNFSLFLLNFSHNSVFNSLYIPHFFLLNFSNLSFTSLRATISLSPSLFLLSFMLLYSSHSLYCSSLYVSNSLTPISFSLHFPLPHSFSYLKLVFPLSLSLYFLTPLYTSR